MWFLQDQEWGPTTWKNMLQRIRWGLWLFGFTCVAAGLAFMFRAGCAGDLKSGSLGDFQTALDLEGSAECFAWGALLTFAIALSIQPNLSPVQRMVGPFVMLPFGYIVIVVASIQFQVWGVQACF
jgi:hypothetical protein